MTAASNPVALTPQEAWQMLQEDPRTLLVDIRSSMEYLFVGHPVGAVHVPWIDEPDWEINPHFVTDIRKLLLGGVVCDTDEASARWRRGAPCRAPASPRSTTWTKVSRGNWTSTTTAAAWAAGATMACPGSSAEATPAGPARHVKLAPSIKRMYPRAPSPQPATTRRDVLRRGRPAHAGGPLRTATAHAACQRRESRLLLGRRGGRAGR
jgi:hypothetical protein